jgi:hypothetical protein
VKKFTPSIGKVEKRNPTNEKVCLGKDLAGVLPELSKEEAKAWGDNLQAARKKLKPPRNIW